MCNSNGHFFQRISTQPKAVLRGWGVFGIGGPTREYWDNMPRSAVKNEMTGGNCDWIAHTDRSNTRAETMHILASMVTMLPVGLDVLHSCDLENNAGKFLQCLHY